MAKAVSTGGYTTSARGDEEIVILFLIFFVSENHKGQSMISEGAQTRLQNIKKQVWYDDVKFKAFCIPIQGIDEIITQVAAIIVKHGGKAKVQIHEIGLFSHAGGDGPISYNTDIVESPVDAGWPHQMGLSGWAKIDFVWARNPFCVFYGCNTGNTSSGWKNFAKSISLLGNFKDVAVWGQSTSSFPSFYPDYRVTSVARSVGDDGVGWNLRGKTYQVGGNAGEGKKAISFRTDKDIISEADLKKDHSKATPLNCYNNGALSRSIHQGIFNDHR